MANTRSYSKRNTRGRSGYFGTSAGFSGTRVSSNWTPKAYNSTQFSTQRRFVTAQIQSLRYLNQQFSGARVTAFSPSTAKSWINFVNNGNYVYKFTNQQFCSTFGTQWAVGSPTTALRYLKQKFGSGIRAVTRGNGNTWLVCASPNVNGRPFSTYTWK